jgi:hypothetical protein
MRSAGRIFALPLMLLALLLQAGAGVAATRAQAEAANPFGSIPICSPNLAKPDPAHQSPAGQHGDHHCGVCLVGAAAQPALLATAATLPPRDRAAVASPALSRHRLPQGPPGRTPNARGPPAFA